MAINQTAQPLSGPAAPPQKARTSFGILGAISLSHLLNDMIQSLILAIYPLLQAEFSLTFVQIGMITLTFQLTSSLFQPVIGYITDKRSMPWSLPVGMCFTLCGLILLALAGSFGMVSGLFFGFAFGMGGLGAAVLGLLADHTSIDLVYKICAFLPLLGFLTIFLPDNRQKA